MAKPENSEVLIKKSHMPCLPPCYSSAAATPFLFPDSRSLQQ